MDHSLKTFIGIYLRVVAIALLPLVVTTFIWIPYTFGWHPGDASSRTEIIGRHMT